MQGECIIKRLFKTIIKDYARKSRICSRIHCSRILFTESLLCGRSRISCAKVEDNILTMIHGNVERVSSIKVSDCFKMQLLKVFWKPWIKQELHGFKVMLIFSPTFIISNLMEKWIRNVYSLEQRFHYHSDSCFSHFFWSYELLLIFCFSFYNHNKFLNFLVQSFIIDEYFSFTAIKCVVVGDGAVGEIKMPIFVFTKRKIVLSDSFR